METKRRKFQGVLNILSFNRHFYVIGFALLALSVLLKVFFAFPDLLFYLLIAAFVYGLIMPLLVSAYVYDFSGYYTFDWLKKFRLNDSSGNKIININAGFDETSFILKEKFPRSNLRVLDFYDPGLHTEAAIVRARKVSFVYPDTQQISTAHIPLDNNSFDLIFMLSAVHEIRSNREKEVFLAECRRICKPEGSVIMVEHLRDIPNFFAFSVGFTHFFTKRVWRKAFENGGFSSFEETKFTPFMSIFQCRP